MGLESASFATNKRAGLLRTLWDFMAGRRSHEKTLGELLAAHLTFWVLESLRTFRYEVLNLPAKLARPKGVQSSVSRPPKKSSHRVPEILDALPEAA